MPTPEHQRDKMLRVKVSQAELDLLTELAQKQGRTLSANVREWIRQQAAEAGLKDA